MTYTAEDIPANHSEPEEASPDYGYIFEAPNWADFFKVKGSAKANEYEKKASAGLKAWFWTAVQNGNAPDAATILDRGPALASATGRLAEANPKVGKILDALTTPNTPLAIFAGAAFAFGSQIARNHEQQIADVPRTFRQKRAARKAAKRGDAPPPEPRKPLFTLRILRRSIPVYGPNIKMRLTFIGATAKSQTENPGVLVHRVFSDQRVQAALKKEGIFFRFSEPEPEPDEG